MWGSEEEPLRCNGTLWALFHHLSFGSGADPVQDPCNLGAILWTSPLLTKFWVEPEWRSLQPVVQDMPSLVSKENLPTNRPLRFCTSFFLVEMLRDVQNEVLQVEQGRFHCQWKKAFQNLSTQGVQPRTFFFYSKGFISKILLSNTIKMHKCCTITMLLITFTLFISGAALNI